MAVLPLAKPAGREGAQAAPEVDEESGHRHAEGDFAALEATTTISTSEARDSVTRRDIASQTVKLYVYIPVAASLRSILNLRRG
jgi:hypothetical protein